MSPPIRVTAALIVRADTVLLARRKPGASLAGFWEFPGGKIEPGETAGQCLEREIFEELGLVVRAGAVFAENIHAYAEKTIHLIALEAAVISGNLTASDHDRVIYAPIPDLLAFRLAPADIPIARKLLSNIGQTRQPLPTQQGR